MAKVSFSDLYEWYTVIINRHINRKTYDLDREGFFREWLPILKEVGWSEEEFNQIVDNMPMH